MSKTYSNVIGVDDGPFQRHQEARVRIVGTVFAGPRLDGVLISDVEKDGSDATDRVFEMIQTSRFLDHTQLLLIQGITVGGFNVLDAGRLHARLNLPVLCVSRKRPDMTAIHEALMKIPGGDEKWRMIETMGPVEAANGIFVQRFGLSLQAAVATIRRFAVHSPIPEPIRMAHLIAGAVVEGQSRGRV